MVTVAGIQKEIEDIGQIYEFSELELPDFPKGPNLGSKRKPIISWAPPHQEIGFISLSINHDFTPELDNYMYFDIHEDYGRICSIKIEVNPSQDLTVYSNFIEQYLNQYKDNFEVDPFQVLDGALELIKSIAHRENLEEPRVLYDTLGNGFYQECSKSPIREQSNNWTRLLLNEEGTRRVLDICKRCSENEVIVVCGKDGNNFTTINAIGGSAELTEYIRRLPDIHVKVFEEYGLTSSDYIIDRLGGDEFAIVFKAKDETQATAILNEISENSNNLRKECLRELLAKKLTTNLPDFEAALLDDKNLSREFTLLLAGITKDSLKIIAQKAKEYLRKDSEDNLSALDAINKAIEDINNESVNLTGSKSLIAPENEVKCGELLKMILKIPLDTKGIDSLKSSDLADISKCQITISSLITILPILHITEHADFSFERIYNRLLADQDPTAIFDSLYTFKQNLDKFMDNSIDLNKFTKSLSELGLTIGKYIDLPTDQNSNKFSSCFEAIFSMYQYNSTFLIDAIPNLSNAKLPGGITGAFATFKPHELQSLIQDELGNTTNNSLVTYIIRELQRAVNVLKESGEVKNSFSDYHAQIDSTKLSPENFRVSDKVRDSEYIPPAYYNSLDPSSFKSEAVRRIIEERKTICQGPWIRSSPQIIQIPIGTFYNIDQDEDPNNIHAFTVVKLEQQLAGTINSVHGNDNLDAKIANVAIDLMEKFPEALLIQSAADLILVFKDVDKNLSERIDKYLDPGLIKASSADETLLDNSNNYKLGQVERWFRALVKFTNTQLGAFNAQASINTNPGIAVYTTTINACNNDPLESLIPSPRG
jgi:GGDEF domain-containing protein